MLHLATFFDINYLSRGLALLQSLKKHSSLPFRLYILALDDETPQYFESHPDQDVNIIRLDLVEQHFPELAAAKSNRSKIEYYFTLSPYLPLYLLDTVADIEQITTMDADLYFFNDPAVIFNTYKDASILITPHNFSEQLKDLQLFGKYNVSFQSFKNNVNGRACLDYWRQNCLEWCYDVLDKENNRFADQKYLDTWPEKFEGVQEIKIPGTGLAPWNLDSYNYQLNGKALTVNGAPLIYFHFHHLRIFDKSFALNSIEHYKVATRHIVLKRIYHPYLKILKSLSSKLNTDSNTLRYTAQLNGGFVRRLKNPQGYWFFNNYIIIHLNPHRWFLGLKRFFNLKIWLS